MVIFAVYVLFVLLRIDNIALKIFLVALRVRLRASARLHAAVRLVRAACVRDYNSIMRFAATAVLRAARVGVSALGELYFLFEGV